MSACRWDREREAYVDQDGDECRRDSYGDPTFHCTAKRSCSVHVAAGELTCARCLNRARQNIKRIVMLAPFALPVALEGGSVNTEAVMLAGPAADYETFSARRRIGMRWIFDRLPEKHQERALTNLLDDDDEWHPYSVLTRWEFMLREDYRQERTDATSITSAAAYLELVLHRVAQDDEQDFGLLSRELKACRNHLENALRTSTTVAERGKPCPTCQESEPNKPAPRLTRHYGHWCDEEDCEQVHYSTLLDHETGLDMPDTSGDWWSCPRHPTDKRHMWTHESYRKWADEREQASA